MRPPFLMFAAVHAIAPVAGIPPKSADATFHAPTKTACQFSVPIPAKNPSSFSIVSIVGIPAGIVTPQKFLLHCHTCSN